MNTIRIRDFIASLKLKVLTDADLANNINRTWGDVSYVATNPQSRNSILRNIHGLANWYDFNTDRVSGYIEHQKTYT